jgi:hypothetical protein
MKDLQRIYLTIWLLSAILMVAESDNTTITTTLGTVTGNVMDHQGVKVGVFYGIPYAKPPVGNLRFMV